MWKKWGLLLLCGLLVLVAACSSQTSSTSSSNGDGAQQQNQQEVIKMKAAIQSPKEADLTKAFDALLDDIEEKSGGRIVFERYYAESLVKATEHLKAIQTGIADVSLVNALVSPSELPLSTINSLPALWNHTKSGTYAMRTLMEKYTQFNEEWEKIGVKIITAQAYPPFFVITVKPEVDSFEEIKGLKLMASGYQGQMVQTLGATPVNVVVTESFEMLERGTIDGAVLGFSSSAAYGIQEIAKSAWRIPIGSSVGLIGINLEKYNSLPDDLKRAIDEAGAEHIDEFIEIYQSGEERAMQKYIDAGVPIYEPTKEDIQYIRQVARENYWNKWIEEMKQKGYPADEIMETYISEIERIEAELGQ